MARVEPINQRSEQERRARQRGERAEPPPPTPGKAEGDEKTVNEVIPSEARDLRKHRQDQG